MRFGRGPSLAALLLTGAGEPVDYVGDARALDALIVAQYAYLDALPGGVLPDSPALQRQRAAVHDRASLLHYAEDRIATLADHHAITGASFRDSWAVVPTYADLWIGAGGSVLAVRAGSPAADAGIAPGDAVATVDDVAIGEAVTAFWARVGLTPTGDRWDHAARVLVAGRRDRPRLLGVRRDGRVRNVTLPSLYAAPSPPIPPAPVTVTRTGGRATIRFNNSLGDSDTVAAFDAAMVSLPSRARVTIDLRDTPSGGNTSVARAVMGWFVRRPTGYQVHDLPAERRRTGIARQWIEQVLPRAGKRHDGTLDVVVGRWTGSMGEGLAIGLRAAGARVCGGAMAQLRGAVEDLTLPSSGMTFKLPVERLSTVDGIAREAFVPPACRDGA